MPPVQARADEPPRVLVIGIGNELRRDDGVGIWVANQVAAARWEGVTVLTLATRDGTALLSAWHGADHVYLIDAAVCDAPAGTILRLDALRHPIPRALRTVSSHGLGVGEAIALGGAMRMLPRRLVIYGIVGQDFQHGTGLSPEVRQAARCVVERVRRAVRRGKPTSHPRRKVSYNVISVSNVANFFTARD